MIRVLAIDDSALAREMLKAILGAEADVELEVVANVEIARARMKRQRPDVMLLDLEMPRTNGVEFMTELVGSSDVPVLICSESNQRSHLARQALSLGAIDILKKPKLRGGNPEPEQVQQLITAIRGAVRLKVGPGGAPGFLSSSAQPVVAPLVGAAEMELGQVVVAIGVSTGGPSALRVVLPRLAVASPPIVVAQHMADGYTAPLAESLNEICALEVCEARAGAVLRAGHVYIAPSGFQTEVRSVGGEYRLDVSHAHPEARFRPSANVLFRSIARAVGAKSVAVLMTGMGDDGADGLLELRRAGAYTLIQDEESCAVYGMPRVAKLLGAAKRQVDLAQMAGAISHHAKQAMRNGCHLTR